jgi:formylglycine-generating enzyme required for sulfatase activity
MATIGVLVLLSSGAALRAQSISMSYVTVGNPGNAPDPATDSFYGEVDYTYNIGEYDVTDSQYCTFLNDVDPTGANTLDLYSPQGDPEFGISVNLGAANGFKYSVINGYASMPVVDVTFWDTLRFANFLDDGSTENGAYTLLGDSPTPSNASTLIAAPQPNSGATVWLPSENEWYKAAYYDPANDTYSAFATQSDTAPGNIIGSGTNEANYNNGVYSVTQSYGYESGTNYLTPVGSFTGSASYYGTYDQSGDAFNWLDTTVDSDYPVLRGGDWYYLGDYGTVSSDYRTYAYPYSLSVADVYGDVGFRVASVPEPNSIMLMLAGVAGLALMRGKPFCRGNNQS